MSAVRGLAAACAVAGLALGAPATARAQHEHHHGHEPAGAGEAAAVRPRPFELGVALTAARYDQDLYAGDYVGASLSAGWRRGRLGVRAALPMYHLRKNGASVDGVGDVALGVDVVAYQRGALTAGVGLGATLPTGAQMTGLGMGHVMLMPMAWLGHDRARGGIMVSAGWCGALGAEAAHHDHGPWPLVEPMSASELMAEVRGEVRLGRGLRATARADVAVPLQGDPTRALVAAGGAWHRAGTVFGAELAAGLAGDPFTLRAQVTSALHF